MMSTTTVPILAQVVGDRFCPTEEEIVNHFLKQKIHGNDDVVSRIPVINICAYEPWDLYRYSGTTSNDLEWHFFCPRYLNCGRPKRTTDAGYWKVTGKDRMIKTEFGDEIGTMKILVFHTGRQPNGVSTRWIMHEYSASFNPLDQTTFVLCKVMKKPDKKVSMPTYGEGGKSGTFGNLAADATLSEEVALEILPYLESFHGCNEQDYSLDHALQ